MEAFVRDIIEKVEDHLGALQAESAVYVKLRESLRELVTDGAEARQTQLTAKPNGKGNQLVPLEPTSLHDRILGAMADGQRRSLGEIVDVCYLGGWTTRSSAPRMVVYEQVRRLVTLGRLRRTGSKRAYFYQLRKG